MSTMFRRRAWRDKRQRQKPTLADLTRADSMIGFGLHCALAGFCLCLLLLMIFLGSGFVNLLFGN